MPAEPVLRDALGRFVYPPLVTAAAFPFPLLRRERDRYARLQVVRDRVTAGASTAELAGELGVSRQRIHQLLGELGTPATGLVLIAPAAVLPAARAARTLRAFLDCSQVDLAGRLGWPISRVSRLERGRNRPKRAAVRALLACAFDVHEPLGAALTADVLAASPDAGLIP